MTKLKSIYCLILLTILLLIPTRLLAKEPATQLVFFNNTVIDFSATPILKENIMYANLRELSVALQLTVTYDADQRAALVSNGQDTLTYMLENQTASFNQASVFVDTPCFIKDDFTWVPIEHFAKLFGYTAIPNDELLITKYMGEEKLDFDYLPKPIYVPIYDYLPVHSIFINESVPAETYTNGTFSAYIKSADLEDGILKLTFSPFTEVTYPSAYHLISDPRLLNISPQTLHLPINPPATYTYLTYSPDTFSTATTHDLYTLFEDILENKLTLAELTVSNGSITSIRQIYVP